MSATRVLLAAVAVVAIASASASAQTFYKSKNGAVTPPKGGVYAPPKAMPRPLPTNTAPRPVSTKPLTTKECRDLGGTVGKSSYCTSGQSCTTVDQNHTQHEVCISKK